MGEAAHEVAARLGTPLRQQRPQKVDELLRRGVAARRIVGEADDVEAPMMEHLVLIDGNPDDVGDDANRDRGGELRDQIGASVADELIDQLVRERADQRRQVVAQRLGHERRGDDAAVFDVLAAVHLQDRPAHDEPDPVGVRPR